jgi:hypothetical protein
MKNEINNSIFDARIGWEQGCQIFFVTDFVWIFALKIYHLATLLGHRLIYEVIDTMLG